ncbi:MAG: C45 family peptidase [Planctomycetales bacterium]|nr:C45 family peptidase [Planctomycetales bacterium]
MNRYREIEVAGPPRELGRQIGEAAGEEIRGFCDVAMSLVHKTARVSPAAADKIVARSFEYAERYSPDMVEELRGMAEAARVSAEQIMLLQVRNQMQPEGDAGCTSLALNAGQHRSSGIVAQNWDNDPDLQPFTVVLTRRPAGKPAVMTITQAGLIAYIGFNDAGIGLCLNTLPAPARITGVPHYFTVRGIYEADSLEGAVQAVRRAERAIPANIMLSTPQGAADLEVTLDDVHVLQDKAAGGVTHTNHCRHPELQAINGQFPELIQSHERQRRIDQLLDLPQRSATLEEVKKLLRDHEGYPRSICRHANDDPKTGFWETVFSVIIEPESRRMHVSRGTPCQHPYEVYTLR